ncbi:Phloem protein 2-like, partial [Dillenia turbinata]
EREMELYMLPEGCISSILSLTSPRDACRLSAVASNFRSAADSDGVWETFLPSDYRLIISRAVDSSSLDFSSKKELYLHLCDSPLLIDGGKLSFWLEKQTGKKCYMIAPRDLFIVWSDTPTYWNWISHPDSRFSEVAELLSVCWLEIRGRIKTSMLSPNTIYAAYLVYKFAATPYGFDHHPTELSIGTSSGKIQTRTVILDPERGHRQPVHFRIRHGRLLRGRLNYPMRLEASAARECETQESHRKERQDGWMEVELGEFYSETGEDGELEMSVMEVKGGNWKGGLIVQGIEIRPQRGK